MPIQSTIGLRLRVRTFCLCALALAGWVVGGQPVAAADFNVNSVADKVDAAPGDGKCSTGGLVDGKTPECTLRAAIDEINALSKSNPTKTYSIALPAGTYFLTASETCVYQEPGDPNLLSRTTTSFCINGNLTLTGDDASTSIIDGGLASRIFVIGRSSVVAVNQVTLQNAVPLGDGFDGGGAAFNNEGTLSLASDVFTQNQAGVLGAVIYNAAKLVVDNCVFDGNVGSAIASSTFDGLNDTSINASYFHNNTAEQGPAVFAFDGARLQISNSTMTANTAEGNGIVFTDNTPTTITNTTVSFNTIQNTGALVSAGDATMTLNNDTIYGNAATNVIGGLYLNTGRAVVSNSIIYGNGEVDCAVASLIDLGHNIIGAVIINTVNVCKTGNLTVVGVDPRLGPLQLDGGAIATQNPLAGSPAINKGSASVPGGDAAGTCAALDERGTARGQSGPCTIGAAEALHGLHVANILPNRGGAGGTVTVTVNGSGFVPGSTLTLRKGVAGLTPTQTNVSVDATSIIATFNLAAAPLGSYDVVVKTPTASTTLPGAFAIQNVTVPNLFAYVTGETAGREGQPNFFTLVYGNTGNVDAYLVPATLSLPGSFVTSIGQIASPPAATGQIIHDWSNAPIQVTPYSVGGSTNVPLIIPVIPAGSQGALLFSTAPPIGADLTVPYNLYASLGDPYGTESGGQLSAASLAQFVAGAQSYAQTKLGVLLTAAQISKMSDYAAGQLANVVDSGEQALLQTQGGQPIFYSNSQLVIDVAAYGASIPASVSGVKSRKALALVVPADEPANPAPQSPVIYCTGQAMLPGSVCIPKDTVAPHLDPKKNDGFIDPGDCAMELHHHISDDGKLCVPDNKKGCGFLPNPFVPSNPFCGTFKIRASLDPNQKTGPLGLGDAHYVSAANSFYYQIEFENSPSATGAAQTVVVTDPLDLMRFDVSTLQLGPISFGPYVVTPPPGLTRYATALDLRPAQNVIVSIGASLNKSTGSLTWRFTSLDPGTMQLTTDADAGFLPPDTAPPAGIGHVAFTVSPLTNVKDGQICNTASIVFDTNAAISTAPFCNVKDTSAPVSHVLPLAASTKNPNFTLSWTGTDVDSGILGYSVYVSDNAGPFHLLTTTTATSTAFTGQGGHQYGFYSIATDRLGNVEGAKTVAEATTTLGTIAGVVVPNVVGSAEAAAAIAITGDGLMVGTVTTQSSATIAVGIVISESPSAGTSAPAKAAVNLVVSSGRPFGDLNGDGVVNCADLAIIKASFGKKAGQAGFDVRADMNGDGVVNIVDLSTEARLMPAGTVCK
jgi:CSLREA domain-containing protein